MATRKKFGTVVKYQETFTYTAIIVDEAGLPIDITDATVLDSMVLTLYDKDSLENIRYEQDVLGTPVADVYPGANDHTLNANGTLKWYGQAGDTAFTSTNPVTMVARYKFVYLDGSIERTGYHEFEFDTIPLDAVIP